MARRKLGEINAGSMADIAFLLLIFFLVTTTMDVDSGIMRQLSPPQEDPEDTPPIRERNVFLVFLNKSDQLMVEGEIMQNASTLCNKVKEFILNPQDKETLSEGETLAEKLDEASQGGDVEKIKEWQELVQTFGSTKKISKGVVSLQSDYGTEYGKYIEVQNEIMRAFNELKNEASKRYFGQSYDDLDEDKQKMIKKISPTSISEAEPRRIGG